MSSVIWRHLAGDTESFAIEFTLIRTLDDDSMVDPEERVTWGSIATWIGGLNVCEHSVQGERLQAAHWYLLPVTEWFTENWDALFHEERLPRESAGKTAERGARRCALLAELDATNGDDFESAEIFQNWTDRHRFRSSAPGAILPDLYVRRYGDTIEFSMGADRIPGQDWGVNFTSTPTQRVPVHSVAEALESALRACVHEFSRRHVDSQRIQALERKVSALRSPDRYPARFAWLSGAGGDVESFTNIWQEVEEVFSQDRQESLSRWMPTQSAEPLYLDSSPVTLLFGSLSPTVAVGDVQRIFAKLLEIEHENTSAATLAELGKWLFDTTALAGLTPGEAGSLCGEEAWRRLSGDSPPAADGQPVDIVGVLTRLDIWVRNTTLEDRALRAVSILTEHGSAGIVVNQSYRLGTQGPVLRFTLAHELAHLLLDQNRARQLVVASGPWAPAEVEQRANAFAAAFLMPLPVLKKALGDLTEELQSPDSVSMVARRLDVSYSALVSRLQNLGRLSPEEAEMLRDRNR